MVASKHTKFIEGRQQLIATDIIDSEDTDEDGSIDDDCDAWEEKEGSGLGEAGARTGVNKVVTK